MSAKPKITSIEVVSFRSEMTDMGREGTIGIPIYQPGSSISQTVFALKINTDTGLTVDMLIASLKAGKSDDQIKGLLRECKQKGFEADYLTGKVTKEIDAHAAMRIRRLI